MKAAIIGAGVAGLSAAWDLRQTGWDVEIFEAGDNVGGLASGFKEPDWDWSLEKYYHHWFASDRDMLQLLDELGLRSKVLFTTPITAVYHDGEFYALDSPIAVLRFPGIPFFDRIRFGALVALFKLIPDGTFLEKYRAEEWLLHWAGRRTYESLWQPMLEGKFGPHYRDVNMAWFWARFKARTQKLGTFEGGFQAFLDAFAGQLQQAGVRIHLQEPVSLLEADPDGQVLVRFTNGEERFDRVLVTTSPELFSHICPKLPEDYLVRIRSLRSMGALVLILALKQPLSPDGIYWHNLPKKAGFPFLSLVEHTNFLPRGHYGGETLIYCGDYLDPDHEYFSLSKEQLTEVFLPALRRINADFQPDWIRKTWMFRTKYAQPIPEVHHSRVIPDVKTPIPGVWFASMSQVYPWDRGTNFAVEIGRRAARQIQVSVAERRS
ncbi:MAG: NAD(P)/FAD-dependent oxidoreductase [Anaerolineales bacterium]|nr:NAD(P)/FAD-dependent oxidoreductase [Anaerolineales bacterium]